MIEWWQGLSALGNIFFTIAFCATLILVIQTVMLLFGMGFSEAEVDFEADMEGVSLFTVRGLVAFFSVGGWTGLILVNLNLHGIVAILISIVAGYLALIAVAYIFKFAMKLQADATMDINYAVGRTGEVYIPIPAQKTGHGKVNLLLHDTVVELEAVTEDEQIIKTGQQIRVLSALDNQTVLVTSANTFIKDDETNQDEEGAMS